MPGIMKAQLSRREFLKLGYLGLAGFALGCHMQRPDTEIPAQLTEHPTSSSTGIEAIVQASETLKVPDNNTEQAVTKEATQIETPKASVTIYKADTKTPVRQTATEEPTSLPTATLTPSPKKPYVLEKLCIYYGYPSMVNESAGDITRASGVFAHFDRLILADRLILPEVHSEPSHQDYNKTKQIVQILQEGHTGRKTIVYGYINLGCTDPPPTPQMLADLVDAWKQLGVQGVFLDCVADGYFVDKALIGKATEIAHNKGVYSFFNSHTPELVLQSAKLLESDSILIEPLFMSDGIDYNYPYIGLDKLIQETNVGFFGVATYDVKESMIQWKKQYALLKGKAENIGLMGFAFTTSGYSASGFGANQVSIFG